MNYRIHMLDGPAHGRSLVCPLPPPEVYYVAIAAPITVTASNDTPPAPTFRRHRYVRNVMPWPFPAKDGNYLWSYSYVGDET